MRNPFKKKTGGNIIFAALNGFTDLTSKLEKGMETLAEERQKNLQEVYESEQKHKALVATKDQELTEINIAEGAAKVAIHNVSVLLGLNG